MPTMSFRARGAALVTDYESQAVGIRRFVGRRFNPNHGPEIDHPDPGRGRFRPGGFEPLEEPDTLSVHPRHVVHYVEAVRTGSLWPADKATADLCGVPFDPSFGGDYDAAPVQEH